MYKIRGADNNEYGPITADQVREWIRENRLNRASFADNTEAPGWKSLGEFPEFAEALAAPPTVATGGSAVASPAYSAPLADPTTAAATLKVPAILVTTLGVLGLAFTVASPFLKKFWIDLLLHFFERMNVPLPPEARDQMETAASAGFKLQDAFGLVLGLVVNTVIVLGGLKLLKLQTWGLGLAAAILIMLPCGSFCCCIGLPIGIWLIILLNKTGVKSTFR